MNGTFHSQEIERKFLVGHLPADYPSYPGSELAQGYLIAGQEEVEDRRAYAIVA